MKNNKKIRYKMKKLMILGILILTGVSCSVAANKEKTSNTSTGDSAITASDQKTLEKKVKIKNPVTMASIQDMQQS